MISSTLAQIHRNRLMLYAGSNGVFVEKDEYDRSVAKQKEEAYQIRELKRLDAESKQKARQIAIETFRTKPVPIGQKICREDDATIETAKDCWFWASL
jgi:hypothetical protein